MKHGAIVQIAVARRNATTVGNDAQEMFNSWIVDVEMANQEAKSVVVKPIFRKRNPKRENMKKNKPGTSKGTSKETQKGQDEVEDPDEINALSHHSAELAEDDFAKDTVNEIFLGISAKITHRKVILKIFFYSTILWTPFNTRRTDCNFCLF
uniref:Uncharacterized protein n=1 Tax=Acrobeloides nanus TaxID=290746 RepID=A0A914C7X9_9BILA